MSESGKAILGVCVASTYTTASLARGPLLCITPALPATPLSACRCMLWVRCLEAQRQVQRPLHPGPAWCQSAATSASPPGSRKSMRSSVLTYSTSADDTRAVLFYLHPVPHQQKTHVKLCSICNLFHISRRCTSNTILTYSTSADDTNTILTYSTSADDTNSNLFHISRRDT